MMFVSSDKLHQRCAPHFLRDDQEFVWGPELKADLARINEHFKALPETEKERGVMQFARAAPDLDGSIVRRLRTRFMRKGCDDERPVEPPPASDERTKELVDHLLKWKDAPEVAGGAVDAAALTKEPDTMSIQRLVPKRKGSWWLLPKDLPDEPTD